MAPLKEGDKAPYFEGINQDGKKITLEDFKGKKLILYFYPKDNTSGCTAEACSLNDGYSSLTEKGFEVVAREDTNGTFDSALEAAKKILNEQPDITAIMCGNDQMAVGAKTAMNVAEQGQILIYGVDGSPDTKKELKKTENQIAGTVAQSPISMGKDAANTVLNILNGKDYEKEIKENVFMINQENVDMYGVDGWQ